MDTVPITDRGSRRSKLLAPSPGSGWRFAGSRLRSIRSKVARVAAPRAAWLLVSDGRPALAVVRPVD
jgi:hypothetical protein